MARAGHCSFYVTVQGGFTMKFINIVKSDSISMKVVEIVEKLYPRQHMHKRHLIVLGLLGCLSLLVLAGCGGGDSGPGPGEVKSHITYTYDIPVSSVNLAGSDVRIDPSLYEHGLFYGGWIYTDRGEINAMVEQMIIKRVAETEVLYPELSAEIQSALSNYTIVIVDHWGFPCDRSANGMCRGYIKYSATTMWLALYNHRTSPGYPGPLTPPHTIMHVEDLASLTNNGSWRNYADSYYWAQMHYKDIGLPSLPHELKHAVEGSYHGYDIKSAILLHSTNRE